MKFRLHAVGITRAIVANVFIFVFKVFCPVLSVSQQEKDRSICGLLVWCQIMILLFKIVLACIDTLRSTNVSTS